MPKWMAALWRALTDSPSNGLPLVYHQSPPKEPRMSPELRERVARVALADLSAEARALQSRVDEFCKLQRPVLDALADRLGVARSDVSLSHGGAHLHELRMVVMEDLWLVVGHDRIPVPLSLYVPSVSGCGDGTVHRVWRDTPRELPLAVWWSALLEDARDRP